MSRNWDEELKKIDRSLESISDEALLPAKGAASPEAKQAAVEKQKTTTTLGVMLRLVLGVGLGVGMYFWPYSARCGTGLFGYLAATGVVAAAGLWTATWTWRHRSSRAHVLSLLLTLWGLGLAAREVLPRIGYAIPTESHPAVWFCD